jgi:hypothetical protein
MVPDGKQWYDLLNAVADMTSTSGNLVPVCAFGARNKVVSLFWGERNTLWLAGRHLRSCKFRCPSNVDSWVVAEIRFFI